jgi:hypothetical protein
MRGALDILLCCVGELTFDGHGERGVSAACVRRAGSCVCPAAVCWSRCQGMREVR